jgi:hypothetical protein
MKPEAINPGSRIGRYLPFASTRADWEFLFYTAVTLAVFVFLDRALLVVGSMPLESYAEPWLAVEQLRRQGWLRMSVVALAFILLARYGHLMATWADWKAGPELRIFVVVLSAAMVWPFATYGFNFLFDQGHYATRLMLLICLILLWWRPVFIFPLLALLYTVMGQLSVYPLGGSILAHKLQVLHVLNLFAAACLVRAVTANRRPDVFWFLSLCLVAGAYWVAFMAKMNIDWISYGKSYHALPAAYAHGWLSFLDAGRIVDIVHVLKPFDLILQLTVLVFEGGCLLILKDRRIAAALLAGLVLFHTGVFFLYGFLFWTWMLLDAALLTLLLSGRMRLPMDVFRGSNWIVAMVLIASAGFWARPPVLGWFDTRVNYTYKVDAHFADGRRLQLAPQFFAPYEDVFTMASFGYLSASHPLLVGPYGVTSDRRVADALAEPTDSVELLNIEQALGTVRHNAARRENFESFMTRFIANRNLRGAVDSALYTLAPPRQFWSFEGTIVDDRTPITAISVVERTSYFDDRRLQVVREEEVAHIKIPSPPAQ